ncbi:MAG: PorP/SprF family type IX secretion system membrane protein [Sphingobacteriaceae bacterium]
MKQYSKLLGLLIVLLISNRSVAQTNPFDAQYFLNPYIANPAMAGFKEGFRLNAGYRTQWTNFVGSPRYQNAAIDYRTNKVGLGLTIVNTKAGLLGNTKVVGTYTYHLPINGDDKTFSIGMNFGIQNGNFDVRSVNANTNDPVITEVGERKTVADGDIGVAYNSEKFGLEATVYNLKSRFKSMVFNPADYNTFYMASSLKFPLSNFNLATKVAYRAYLEDKDIVDLGAELKTKNEKLGLSAIYHTNKSTSLGISYKQSDKWQFLGVYSSYAKAVSNYTNGSFEVALLINLKKL